MKHDWEVVKEKTQDHWLELYGKLPGVPSGEPAIWRSVVVKWDGCIHFHSYSNLPLELSPDRKDPACCDDYIHICDIDEMISDLQEIKKKALEHFGEWPR